MRAKKSLGQNFLKNTSILRKIAEALDVKEDDTIVEIGPGHGELTRFLVTRTPKELIVIEKDEKLAGDLQQKFDAVQTISGDALKVLSQLNPPKEWKLVGNIPYYITGHLLRILSELPNPPFKTVLLVQKEVAERISAVPPKANLLSSVTRGWASPEYLFTIPRDNFCPVPKVNSAVILLNRDKLIGGEKYYTTVKALFCQPRKKAINNLADSLNISKLNAKKIFEVCNLSPDLRPQNFSLEDIICISRNF
ncbi:MAG: 16S rRNA (adenine(1518)-N(6)/adenine(1519)-N(6))-dimethyltransferase RsmA [Parcubacteria group bacterium]